jgi:hypothetical protein
MIKPFRFVLPILLFLQPLSVQSQVGFNHYDTYGRIAWVDEKARLDNFAISILNDDQVLGYIFVTDELDGCPGEAQARALRAKRYLVEVRGVPWNRVIWMHEGYKAEILSWLLPIKRDVAMGYRSFYSMDGKDGPLTRACKNRLAVIKASR